MAIPKPRRFTAWPMALRRAGWLLAGLGFVALVMAARHRDAQRVCSTVEIALMEPSDLHFLDPSALRSQLGALDADTFVGKPLVEIDLKAIESHLNAMPHVASAQAWLGAGGKLCVSVAQRDPVVRVMHSNGVSYYLDIHGEKLPTTTTFTARVPVVTGIPSQDEEAMTAALDDVLVLAAFWQGDPFLEGLVEQIHRTENGEYELVPKVGQHIVRMGSPAEAPAQLAKLLTFYRDGLCHTGWDDYRHVDLRYRDQVVAKK